MRRREPATEALLMLPCACANLRRAARAATQFYDRELRDSGLNTAQFTLLYTLARTGPVSQGRLARLLALDSTTLSRTLRPLERKRWIRSAPGTDRRERRLSLTGAGRSQLDRSAPAWERAQARFKARIGAPRWEALLKELAALTGAAREA